MFIVLGIYNFVRTINHKLEHHYKVLEVKPNHHFFAIKYFDSFTVCLRCVLNLNVAES